MGIKEEVLSRQDCAQAYLNKDCHELARLLSIGRTKTSLIPISVAQEYLQRMGAWWVLKDIAADVTHPANDAAAAILDVGKARYDNLNVELPLVQSTFDKLVSTGVLPQVLFDNLIQLSNQPEVLSQRDVAIALYQDNGEPK